MRQKRLRMWTAIWLAGLTLWLVAYPAPTPAETTATLPGRDGFGVCLSEFNLQSTELALLQSGGIVTRPLATAQPKVIAAQGLAVICAAPEDFLAMYRSLEAIRHGGSVLACGRFSRTPDLADVAALPVSAETLTELGAAKPGDSNIKLSEAEIQSLKTLRADGVATASRHASVEAYRRMLWARALAYVAQGQDGLPAYADKKERVDARAAYAALFSEQAALSPQQARLCHALRRFPQPDEAGAESFLYWAVQKYGDLKPVTTLVQVFIWRDGERSYVASTLVYANHYTEAGLVIAELIPFADASGRTRTLVAYTVRVQADLLGGQLGFLKKKFAQSKLASTVKGGLASLRTTMTSGAMAARESR